MSSPSIPPAPRGRFAGLGRLEMVLWSGALILVLIALTLLLARLWPGGVSEERPLTIAVVRPDDPQLGEALLNGARLGAEQINAAGGIAGRRVAVIQVPVEGEAGAARSRAAELAADPDMLAVVGDWPAALMAERAAVYAESGLPVLLALGRPDAPEPPGVFALNAAAVTEARFLANYLRNVIGEPTAHILRADTPAAARLAEAFDATYQRFGTRVVNQWAVPAEPEAAEDRLAALAAEIHDQRYPGTLVLIAEAPLAARMLARLRREGVTLPVAALSPVATTGFQKALALDLRAGAAEGGARLEAAGVLDGLVVTTPLLFDIAGEAAQRFRNDYLRQFDVPPDWASAQGRDAVALVAGALMAEPPAPEADAEALREGLTQALGRIDRVERAAAGLAGPLWFPDGRHSDRPVLVGRYNGDDLISAPVQLLPIREAGVRDFLKEVTEGRALYVNDRFMYKSSVVYAGVQLTDIAALDTQANTVELGLLIWFRYRQGQIDPTDIVFTNAVEPIRLEQPIDEVIEGERVYRLYRVRAAFHTNHAKVARPYGAHLVGVGFQHATLSRNNLLYVTDVLGLGIAGRSTIEATLDRESVVARARRVDADAAAWLRGLRLLQGEGGEGRETASLLARAQALAPLSGWRIERAWIAQETVARGSLGAPAFVGFGRPEADFSTIDLGVIIMPERIALADFVGPDALGWLALAALVGAFAAALIDRLARDHTGPGRFAGRTMVLRLISWPLLLAALGNMLLGWALTNATTATIDLILLVYNCLWWLVPAHLVVISLERFLWTPLERRTERKVPRVIRLFAAIAVYLFALFGIVAFVFEQHVTSLLATSGLLAMIIGLAIQANIANVFSGIILNVERPFSIGEVVRIGDVTGIVSDIDWRSVKLENWNGETFRLPNGKVSESEIINYSKHGYTFATSVAYVDPAYDPEYVRDLLTRAIEDVPELVRTEDSLTWPRVRFRGYTDVGLHYAAKFTFEFAINHLLRAGFLTDKVWQSIHRHFRAAGIPVTLPMAPYHPAIVEGSGGRALTGGSGYGDGDGDS